MPESTTASQLKAAGRYAEAFILSSTDLCPLYQLIDARKIRTTLSEEKSGQLENRMTDSKGRIPHGIDGFHFLILPNECPSITRDVERSEDLGAKMPRRPLHVASTTGGCRCPNHDAHDHCF